MPLILAGLSIIGSIVLLLSSPVHSQQGDVVGNLHVLPADMDRKSIEHVMHGFTRALGVGCSHCHARDPENPRTLDHSLDEKESKEVAREMMRMTQAINSEFLIETGRADLREVTCETCHRGHTRPQTLLQALQETMESSGPDSVMQEYRRLRKEFYGRAGYDFGERAIWPIARHFTEAGESGVAEALLRLNAENYPESFGTYLELGFLLENKGERDGAIQSFERALKLEPRAKFIEERIEKLQGQD